MRLIKTHNIARAHELVVEMVMRHGYPVTTEDGEETIECEEICIKIAEPFAEPRISPKSSMKERAMMEYSDQIVCGGKNRFDYDYHDRLFNYGEDHQSSQITYIVNKLKEHKTSRRALAITWKPDIDWTARNVPCLQLVLCTIRDDKLHMKVVFRSNDMLSAFGANAYGLTALQKFIADNVGVDVGTYTHISLIPHIYHIRDASMLEAFND